MVMWYNAGDFFMCSDQRSFFKNLVAVFVCLTAVSAIIFCVKAAPVCAEEGRYPENLAWRLVFLLLMSMARNTPPKKVVKVAKKAHTNVQLSTRPKA